ncbi:hypothetical protein [Acanthopleuribacter pedis]|uniref:Uncharacterized protein n=1 Tax=Acanthopleuribacter pedis TaxID=442870 RepID=A0A8J7U7G2_9BACT|nr:hypothetical protein [Acanthopleuribacter pedis]MBO1322483.1 hypothetical protein [Acanthopleuribacter pedis]
MSHATPDFRVMWNKISGISSENKHGKNDSKPAVDFFHLRSRIHGVTFLFPMTQEETLLLILKKVENIEASSAKRDEAITELQTMTAELQTMTAELQTSGQRRDKVLDDLSKFAAEQIVINTENAERFERIETTLEEMRKDKDISHHALVTLIEEEVIARLDARDEKAMLYTDYQIKDHEERFHHVPVGA